MPHGKLDVYVEGAVQIKDTTILGNSLLSFLSSVAECAARLGLNSD